MVWYWHWDTRVSRLTSLLFLLGQELCRQPRAVYQILGAVPSLLGGLVRSGWFSLYGPSYLAVTCPLFSLVRQWILVTSVYSGFCVRLLKMFRFQRNAWFDIGSRR